METLKNYWLGLNWIRKLFLFVSTHIFINIIIGMIFFMDDISFIYQIVHSCIHLLFFLLAIKLLYMPNKELLLSNKKEKLWFVGFVFLNLIPFFQGYEPNDNGFTPNWEILPQTNLGLPYVYLRWFPNDMLYKESINTNLLVHINTLSLNLYICSLYTIVALAIKNRIIKKV